MPAVAAVRRLVLRALVPAAALPGCAPVDVLNALVPTDGLLVERGIAYGPADRQRLDRYAPPAGAGDAPVVVFFYGGAWTSGERGDYVFVGEALARRGFVALIVDHRLNPQVVFPAFVEDGAKAVAWVAERAGDAPLFLMGHSSGAHIAALLALDRHWLEAEGIDGDRRIAGAVLLAGPYDFLPITDPEVAAVFAGEGDLRETQPITFARAGAPPLLIVTGDADRTVDPQNSKRLAAAMARAGGRAELAVEPGLGHAALVAAIARPLRWLAPVLEEAVGFMRRTVPRQ
jgi:acetyl esterase/lipase